MKDYSDTTSELAKLRRRAKARLAKNKTALPRDEADVQKLLHELLVHQIELEIQNEELLAARDAVEASLVRYSDLYDFAPVGYFTLERDGIICQANLTGAGMLGVMRSHIRNKRLRSFVHADSLPAFNDFMIRVFASNTKQFCEITLAPTPQHPQLEVHIESICDEQGLTCSAVLFDITARKQAEADLSRVDTLQNAILTSADFSIIATDAHGVIQLFNAGAERMLGYSVAEVVNKLSPSDMHDAQEVRERAQALSYEFGTPIAPGFQALAYKAARGIVDTYDLTYVCRDGKRFPAIVSITALHAQGKIIGYLLIGADNSARKQAEEELKSAKATAEKASMAKSDFISNMSHELCTPLNAILGFAQLLTIDATPPTPAQKESIDQILQAGWFLLKLINEILDLSLIESGKKMMSPEPVAVREVLQECHSMIKPQAKERGLNIIFPADCPYYVQADRTRLMEVLINLLSNALKYNCEQGSIIVDCVAHDAEHIIISVKDTGAGLPEEKVEQLFQPFNRLGQEQGREEGTGIGLAISKRLVEAMGGSIGVVSTPGVGSMFWIELNAAQATRALPGSELAALTQTQSRADMSARTLLYVEDNVANLKLVEQLVARRPDLRMLSASDGHMGIAVARTHQPDVILMDINLPGLNGLEVMKILNTDPLTAHIPIVALSANAIPRDVETGLQAGFFRYLTKPIKVHEFMDTLDVVLEFPRGQGQVTGERT
ncbi:MAG: ATP-binding protein [Gallionellaceae bacterium]|nr:ATP-binding protein [Gallionellaceae bacterium]